MNKRNLHKQQLNTQANASVVESEEKNPETNSLLPPELSFNAPQEEPEDLQEEVKIEEKQESTETSNQTADDDDSSSDNNGDKHSNGNSLPTLQLNKSNPKDQTNASGKVSEASKVQTETKETEPHEEVKSIEQQELLTSSKQTADDESPSDNNNKPINANGNRSTPFQLKKSTPKKQTNPISGFQVPETPQKQKESPGKPQFELDKTVQKQKERPKKPRFQLGGNAKDGQGTAPNGLPNALNKKMAKAFKYDFSKVEIHKNSTRAKQVGAYAFAQGKEVHFAHGYYQPETKEGQELIGHELAHVKQQAEGRVKPTTTVDDIPVNDDQRLEKEADDQGKKAARGEDVGASSINKDEKSATLQGSFTSTGFGKSIMGSKPTFGSKLLGGSNPITANNKSDGLFSIADGFGSELVEMPEAAIPEFTLNGSLLNINLENVLDSQVVTINLNINPIVTIVTAEIIFYDAVYDSAKLNVKIASLPDSKFILYVDKAGKVDPDLTIDESIQVLGMEASLDAKVTNEGVNGSLSVTITQPIPITDFITATEGNISLDLAQGGPFVGSIVVESKDQLFVGTAEVEYDQILSSWAGFATLSTKAPTPIEIAPGVELIIPTGVTLEFNFGYEGTTTEILLPLLIELSLESQSGIQAAGLAELTIILGAEGVSIIPSTFTLAITGGLTTPDMDTILSKEVLTTQVDIGALLTLTFEASGMLTEALLVATGGFSSAERRIGRLEYAGLINLNPSIEDGLLDGIVTLTSEAELDLSFGEQSKFSLVMSVDSELSVYHDETGIFAIELDLELALKQLEERIAELQFVGAGLGEEFKIEATIILVKELKIIEATATQYGLSIRDGSTAQILFENGALKQLDGTLGLGVQDTEGDLFEGAYTGVVAFDEAGELTISEGTASLTLLRNKEIAVGTGRVTILADSGVEASFEEGKLSTIKGIVLGTYEDRAFIIDLTANLDYDMINQSLTSLEAELTLEKDIELFKKEESFLTLNGITGSLIIKEDELIQIGGAGILTGKFGAINLTGEAELAWANEGEEANFTGSGTLTMTKEATEGNPHKWFEGTLALSFAGSEFEASGEIEIGLTEGLSGAASFEVDQEMDPVISAELNYEDTAMEGEELWATEFDMELAKIPVWYAIFLVYGFRFGASLNTRPLNIGGSVAIENWRPKSETFPHFNVGLEANWGIDFAAKLMLYAQLEAGDDYFGLYAGIRGGLGVDMSLELKPEVQLVSNEQGIGGQVAANVVIAPLLKAILEAYLGWNFLFFSGEEVWPIDDKEIGNLEDINWEGKFSFGDEAALTGAPDAAPAATENKVNPSASIIPNTENNELGFGNKEANGNQTEGQASSSNILSAPTEENSTMGNFIGEGTKLGDIIKFLQGLQEIHESLRNPEKFVQILAAEAIRFAENTAEFVEKLVHKLIEFGAAFVDNPARSVLDAIHSAVELGLGTIESIMEGVADGVEAVGSVFTSFLELVGFWDDKPTTYVLPEEDLYYWAVTAFDHISYTPYVRIMYDQHDKTVQKLILKSKKEIGDLVSTDPAYRAILLGRCSAPGKIDYAHPWETFETIASIAYDDPTYGERLQRYNPTISEVKEGDSVDIPTKEELGPLYEEIPPIPVGDTGLTTQIRVKEMTVIQTHFIPFMTVSGSDITEQEMVGIANSLISSDSGIQLYNYGQKLKSFAQVWAVDTMGTVETKLKEAASYLNFLLSNGALFINKGGKEIVVNLNIIFDENGQPTTITPLEQAKQGDTITLGNHSLEDVAKKIYGHKERAAWIKEYQTKSQSSKPQGLSADAGFGQVFKLPNWLDMAGMDALPLDKRGVAPQSRIKVASSDNWSSLSMTAFGDWKKALSLSDYSSNAGNKLKQGLEIKLPHSDQLKESTVDIDQLQKDPSWTGSYTEQGDLEPEDNTRPKINPPAEIQTQNGDTWSGLAQAAYGDFSLFPKLSDYKTNKQIRGLVPGTWVIIPKKEDLDKVDPFSLGLSLNGYPLLTEMVRFQSANGIAHHVWVEDRRNEATRINTPFDPAKKPGVWMMASNLFELAPEIRQLEQETKGDPLHGHVVNVRKMVDGTQTTNAINKAKTSLKKLTDERVLAEEIDPFEKKLDDIEAKYRKIIAWARVARYTVAADNLERFLNGVGGLITINSSWLRSQRQVREKEWNHRLWFQSVLENFAREMEDGDSWEREHSINSVIIADKRDGEAPSHLFFASGSSYFEANGKFSLNKKSNMVRMSGKVTNYWHDVYDWHAKLNAHVPFFGTISDKDALLMKEHRGAKDFSMRSIWSQTLTGTIIHQEKPAGTRTSYDWDG